ncbi:MAG: hypothetical protein J6866_08420, partial [Victivallales bacterium]|nr:hypothetical protein [Victivallales bacterium]
LQTLEGISPAHCGTNLATVCASLLKTVNRPSRLVVISDFPEITDDCRDLLRQLSLHHDIMLCWLAEQPYHNLPVGSFLAIREAESGRNGLHAANGENDQPQRRALLADLAASLGSELLSLTPDRPPAEALLDYLQAGKSCTIVHH